MMCRLAFHTVSTAQALASWSAPNTQSASPLGPATKPSSDIDIFRINSLIAFSSRESGPRMGQIPITTNGRTRIRQTVRKFYALARIKYFLGRLGEHDICLDGVDKGVKPEGNRFKVGYTPVEGGAWVRVTFSSLVSRAKDGAIHTWAIHQRWMELMAASEAPCPLSTRYRRPAPILLTMSRPPDLDSEVGTCSCWIRIVDPDSRCLPLWLGASS